MLDRLRDVGGKSLDRLKESERGQMAAQRWDQGVRHATERLERLKEQGDAHPVARRRLVIAVPAAAGLALVAGAADAGVSSAKPAAGTLVRARAVARPRTPPVE